MVKKLKTPEGESKGKGSSIGWQLLVSILIVAALDFLTGFMIIPENYNSFRTPHYYYHHGLQPDQDRWAAWGSSLYPFRTNSLGMIDTIVYRVNLKTNKQRLLILGDSHSEGVGVPYPKTFGGLLANEMRQELEVLNASCISYSPKIEYLKAKFLFEEGLKVDHIFVLIDISDMQNELVYEGFEPAEKSWMHDAWHSGKFFLKKYSSIFYLVSSIIDKRQTRDFFERAKFFNEQGALEMPVNTLELYASFFRDFDDNVLLSNPQFHGVGEWYYNDRFKKLADRGIALGQKNILRLKELCDSQHVKLTISVHPWHYQILKANDHDYYVQAWETFAAAHNIDFVNLFPLFITSQNPVISTRMFFIEGDNHWNEFGHALVANRLKRYFRGEESSTTH